MLSCRIFRHIICFVYVREFWMCKMCKNFGCVRCPRCNLEDNLCEWWVKCEWKRWRQRGKHPQLGPRAHQPQLGNLTARQGGELFLFRRRHFGQMSATCLGSQQSRHIREAINWEAKPFFEPYLCFLFVLSFPWLFYCVVAPLHGWPECKEYEGLVGKRRKNRVSASREPECYDFLPC